MFLLPENISAVQNDESEEASPQKNLGGKVISGLLWKFSELMAAQTVAFIVSIVLARILEPKDYGTIAITTVFILIANVFVTSGFSNALVQKMGADDTDFSSVFYFNIVFSSLVYLVIFLIAPFVADFYKSPVLCPVLRVISIQIIIAAVNSVQQAYVSKNMLFKRFFFSTSIGTVVSAFVGIGVALWGGGVWALVAQQLCNVTMDTMILWITVKWRPVLRFDIKRLLGLLKFGWKILVSGLIYTIYDNFKKKTKLINKVMIYKINECDYCHKVFQESDTFILYNCGHICHNSDLCCTNDKECKICYIEKEKMTIGSLNAKKINKIMNEYKKWLQN